MLLRNSPLTHEVSDDTRAAAMKLAADLGGSVFHHAEAISAAAEVIDRRAEDVRRDLNDVVVVGVCLAVAILGLTLVVAVTAAE